MNYAMKRQILLVLIMISYVACSSTGDKEGDGDGGGDDAASEICAYVAVSGRNGPSGIWTYSIDAATGALTQLSGSPFFSSWVTRPHSLVIDPTGKFVYVGDSREGSTVSAYRINATTGALTEIPGSQASSGPNAYKMLVDPLGRFLYIANIEEYPAINHISSYAIDAATGALAEIAGSPFEAGTEILTMVVDPTGKFLYEACGSYVTGYLIDQVTGVLTEIPGSALPRVWTYAMAFDPSGRFLYIANRWENVRIACYAIDATTGILTETGGSPFPSGDSPLHLVADRGGKFLYEVGGELYDGRMHGYIKIYAIDTGTGALSETANSPYRNGVDLGCIAIDPTGKYAYVSNSSFSDSRNYISNIFGFSIDAVTGGLTLLDGSPFEIGLGGMALAITRIR